MYIPEFWAGVIIGAVGMLIVLVILTSGRGKDKNNESKY